MTRRVSTLVWAWLITGAAACGDDGPPTSSSTATVEPGVEYTVDNVCDHVARRLCEAREDCCRSVELPYDEVRCMARERDNCERTIDIIDAGGAELNPEHVDGCIEEAERLLLRCIIPPSDAVYEVFDVGHACALAFTGESAPGASCTSDAECASSADSIGACDDDSLVCVVTTVHFEGGACDTTGTFCAPGLYCDFDLTQMPFTGTCSPALLPGDSCDSAALVSPCGPGQHCDSATSTCGVNKPFGDMCGDDAECDSNVCEVGMCTLPPPIVDINECTGG